MVCATTLLLAQPTAHCECRLGPWTLAYWTNLTLKHPTGPTITDLLQALDAYIYTTFCKWIANVEYQYYVDAECQYRMSVLDVNINVEC